MLRALLAVVFVVVSYFALCFLVGGVAGAQAGSHDPEHAAAIGARAGARAVEEYRPYIIGGALTVGIVAAGFLPLGRRKNADVPTVPPADPSHPLALAEMEKQVHQEFGGPNPLWSLWKPAVGLVGVAMGVAFWVFLYRGVRSAQDAAVAPGSLVPANFHVGGPAIQFKPIDIKSIQPVPVYVPPTPPPQPRVNIPGMPRR